jgi:hypothetical protein
MAQREERPRPDPVTRPVLVVATAIAHHLLDTLPTLALPGPITGQLAREVFEALQEPDPLDVRAREVSEALARARDLLGELQAEVTARSQIIEGLAVETKQAEQRAQDAAARAGLTEREAEAVDALLSSALKQRLGELERRARLREWSLATVVALIVGLASILISHFIFGF